MSGKEPEKNDFFHSSVFAAWGLLMANGIVKYMTACLAESKVQFFLKQLPGRTFFNPKNVGIMIVTAIVTNMIICALLLKDIGSLGLWNRACLFLFGGMMISCSCDWRSLNSSSFIMKFFVKCANAKR